METPIFLNRGRQLFGSDCIFGIVDWAGILGSLDRNGATVTGTLEEVDTPYGTGLQVAAANSHIDFNWPLVAPLLTQARSIFARFYLPSVSSMYGLVGWGAAANQNASFIYNNSGQYGGGLANDADAGGTLSSGWFTIGWTNAGVNGGANIVYGQGSPAASGTNGSDAITTYSALRILNFAHADFPCPVGSIVKELLAFNRVLADDEVEGLHEEFVGAL